MIDSKERRRERRWEQKEVDYDYHYYKWEKKCRKNSKESSGQWEKYGVTYLRNTETGQIINKENGKTVSQVFLDQL